MLTGGVLRMAAEVITMVVGVVTIGVITMVVTIIAGAVGTQAYGLVPVGAHGHPGGGQHTIHTVLIIIHTTLTIQNHL